MEDTAVKRNPYAGSFFNLSGEKGEYTILYFWEADCGHCKKTIPLLHSFFNKMKDKGVKVIAVNMLGGIEGKVAWVDFVNEHKLYGWINAWNPYDFSSRDAYDVSSSNTLFLLDENMKILAKKITPEQAEAIIENEMKKKSNN
jgi:thiol-disulfide isomerase/thioredoxin